MTDGNQSLKLFCFIKLLKSLFIFVKLLPINLKNQSLINFLYGVIVCEEFAEVCLYVIAPKGNAASFKKALQRLRKIGSTVLNLTSPSYKPQVFCLRNVRVTTQPTDC